MSASLREQLHESATHVEPLGDIDKAIASGVQRRNRTVVVVAAVAMTCAVILAAVIFAAAPGISQPEPLRPPTPSPPHDSRVFGWPDTGRNAPGVYSLDGERCGSGGPGGYCTLSFMHNGYGSGDVDINIRVLADDYDSEDRASVVVAGHDGVYRSIGDRYEQWVVDIEGTMIGINLKAKPDTSPADLAEAHAIIDSMYTEPSDNDLGFRLVFTLASNDWDSG